MAIAIAERIKGMLQDCWKHSWLGHCCRRTMFTLLPVTLLLSGCANDSMHRELRSLRQMMAEQRSAQLLVEGRVRGIEEFLTYCPDEVKKLVGQVEQACDSGEYCEMKEKDIRLQVLDVARWNGGRFLSLMQDRKHVPLFLPPEGRELREVERKQLRDLIEPAWLDDNDRRTRFLVVSHPSGSDSTAYQYAKRRGSKVIEEMTRIVNRLHAPSPQVSQAVPIVPAALMNAASGSQPYSAVGASNPPASAPSVARPMPTDAPFDAQSPPLPSGPDAPGSHTRLILHWVFPFYRDGDVLRPEDRPPRGLQDLRSSVFVFRVEC